MSLFESFTKSLNESNEKSKLREIVFGEGTTMGDTTYVVKTDAPKKVLKDLLKRSNEVYLNGGDYEDVPNWANELEDMGYTFEFMDEDYAVNSGKYEPKERYFIENQPDLVNEAENTESEYMKMFKDYCKGKIKELGTVEVETDDWDSDEENATKKVEVKVAFTQKIRDYGECKVLDGSDTIDKLDSDGENLEFVTEKGEYVNTPMTTPDNLLGRLEFDAISKKCYEETLYYWDELYMDENIENWHKDNLKEAVEVSYDDNYDFKSDGSEDAVYCANCAQQESNLKESWYSDSFESIEGVEKEVGDNYTVYKYYDGNNRPIAAMFYGKTQKPNFHTRFVNDQERDEYIQEYINQRESRNKANAERRQARKLTKDHDIQVGDIYYTSWGYDQTNIDYYQVVNVRGSRIDLKELKQEVVETYPGSEYVMPVKDDFASDRIYTVSARADGTVTNLSSFEYLSKWDGRPHYQTDGYSGH